LRSGLKLSLICAVIALLVASAGPSSPAATASSPTPSQADQLRSERAQLLLKLQALSGPRAGARSQLLAAEQGFAQLQSRLVDARQRLAAINTSLAQLSRQIADDEHNVLAAKQQLGALIRATYEVAGNDGFATAVFSASDFSQAVDRLRAAQHVGDQVTRLQAQLDSGERALAAERASLQTEGAQAQALEQGLGDDSNRLTVVVVQRDVSLAAVDGPARAMASRIAQIDQELAPPPPPAPGVASSHSCGNRFAYGYCTYYVATRRCIPWLGNAWQWMGNAAAMGYREGHTPARGAVAVWGRGGYSPEGHVAFVEQVGPAAGVPAGSFLISEMNFRGWNRVDYRVVPDNAPGLVGFIY
jgi:surface antigen/peptidoglycan hydrolase CwlO-like protein